MKSSSIAELALLLSLSGFFREDRGISEGEIWYGLISWLYRLCIRDSFMKFNLNPVYGVGFKVPKEDETKLTKEEISKMMFNTAKDTHYKEYAVLGVIFRCIREFTKVDQASKDLVFEFLARMKGSNEKLDRFAEKFTCDLTRCIIPSDDIPEV